MKVTTLRNKLALAFGLSFVVLLGVVVYASTPTILGEGTMPYSEVMR